MKFDFSDEWVCSICGTLDTVQQRDDHRYDKDPHSDSNWTLTISDTQFKKLQEENAQLRLKIANLDGDNIKERQALKERITDLEDEVARLNNIKTVARKFYRTIKDAMVFFSVLDQ